MCSLQKTIARGHVLSAEKQLHLGIAFFMAFFFMATHTSPQSEADNDPIDIGRRTKAVEKRSNKQQPVVLVAKWPVVAAADAAATAVVQQQQQQQ